MVSRILLHGQCFDVHLTLSRLKYVFRHYFSIFPPVYKFKKKRILQEYNNFIGEVETLR